MNVFVRRTIGRGMNRSHIKFNFLILPLPMVSGMRQHSISIAINRKYSGAIKYSL